MQPNKWMLDHATIDFCISTIEEAKKRGDKEMELAYTMKLLELELSK